MTDAPAAAASADAPAKQSKVPPPHRTLLRYAAFLGACGVGGFVAGGATAKAATALMFGGGGAVLMALLGVLSRPSTADATRAMAVHLALVLCMVFTGVFAWRAKLAWAVPEKRYLSYLLAAMAFGSFLALAHLIVAKPKPKSKAATAAAAGAEADANKQH